MNSQGRASGGGVAGAGRRTTAPPRYGALLASGSGVAGAGSRSSATPLRPSQGRWNAWVLSWLVSSPGRNPRPSPGARNRSLRATTAMRAGVPGIAP